MLSKMKLNRMKYPIAVAKGSIQKYTNYSSVTGYNDSMEELCKVSPMEADVHYLDSFNNMAEFVEEFAKERDWIKCDSPMNVALAVVAEVGELSSCTLWLSGLNFVAEVPTSLHAKILHEVADIIIYFFWLAHHQDRA